MWSGKNKKKHHYQNNQIARPRCCKFICNNFLGNVAKSLYIFIKSCKCLQWISKSISETYCKVLMNTKSKEMITTNSIYVACHLNIFWKIFTVFLQRSFLQKSKLQFLQKYLISNIKCNISIPSRHTHEISWKWYIVVS